MVLFVSDLLNLSGVLWLLDCFCLDLAVLRVELEVLLVEHDSSIGTPFEVPSKCAKSSQDPWSFTLLGLLLSVGSPEAARPFRLSSGACKYRKLASERILNPGTLGCSPYLQAVLKRDYGTSNPCQGWTLGIRGSIPTRTPQAPRSPGCSWRWSPALRWW